jgi:hypothetical protein
MRVTIYGFLPICFSCMRAPMIYFRVVTNMNGRQNKGSLGPERKFIYFKKDIAKLRVKVFLIFYCNQWFKVYDPL